MARLPGPASRTAENHDRRCTDRAFRRIDDACFGGAGEARPRDGPAGPARRARPWPRAVRSRTAPEDGGVRPRGDIVTVEITRSRTTWALWGAHRLRRAGLQRHLPHEGQPGAHRGRQQRPRARGCWLRRRVGRANLRRGRAAITPHRALPCAGNPGA
jgi:hypothetical protein